MTKVQTAKRQMAEAVAAFFLQHPEILQESVLLSETVDELKQQLLMLTANLSIQTRSLKGDTVSKHAMADTMADLTDRYGKTLISLFWKRKLVSEQTQAEAILSIPNQLEFMHKSIIPGVHEIAALVTKIACTRWLGINRL